MPIKQTVWLLAAALVAVSLVIAQAPAEAPKGAPPQAPAKGKGAKGPFQSPASAVRPKAAAKQDYAPDLVRAGEAKFVAECGFCHGRDAAGGETGPDLTRSEVVVADMRGDKIAPLVRAGVPDQGMPAFRLTDAEMNGLVAFIHTQQAKFESLGGNRRSVLPEDLLTGNATAGRAYFAANCGRCHSATGDLKDIAARFQGLQLMQRMLYPSGRGGTTRPKATVTLASGQIITGSVVSEDEFSVVVENGTERQSFQKSLVPYTIDYPLQAHFEQLGRYTDADIHNLYAFLVTLK